MTARPVDGRYTLRQRSFRRRNASTRDDTASASGPAARGSGSRHRVLRGCPPNPPATGKWSRVKPLIGVEDLAPWQFDMYVGAEVDGDATPEQLAVLEADPVAWRASLLRMLRDAEEHLASARSLPGEERDQVVADLESEHRRLAAACERADTERTRGDRAPTARPARTPPAAVVTTAVEPRRRAVPSRRHGPSCRSRGNRAGSSRGPAVRNAAVGDARAGRADARRGGRARRRAGRAHAPVPLPGWRATPTRSAIPVGEVLGWLVAAGRGSGRRRHRPERALAGPGRDLGGRAHRARRDGPAAAPAHARQRRARSESNGSYSVRWTPALVDPARLARMVDDDAGQRARPRREGRRARALTRSALTGMVDAICRDSARRLEVPAPPPRVRTATDVAEAFLARLDGSAFDAPVAHRAARSSTRVERWARSVTGEHAALDRAARPARRRRRVAPRGVRARADGRARRRSSRRSSTAGPNRPHLEDEIARLERMLPALLRPGGTRRGEVILSQDEAWELMAVTGPQLAGRRLRRARARAVAAQAGAVAARVRRRGVEVGRRREPARQRALVGGVRRRRAHRGRHRARWPRKRGRSSAPADAGSRSTSADLDGRGRRARRTRRRRPQLSGAEMLRLALGLEGSPLAGGISSTAAAGRPICSRPRPTSRPSPARAPDGLRRRAPQLPGRGAGVARLPRLGRARRLPRARHGPRQDADDARPPARRRRRRARAGDRAARGRRQLGRGGRALHARACASSCTTARTAPRPTRSRPRSPTPTSSSPPTAPRCATSTRSPTVAWARVVLDEAQAIKNPANDTSQQLRRIPARTRIALTGTPIENGLGDLWAILDFTNPGLVGPRPQFIAALSSDGDRDARRRPRTRCARSTASSCSGARRPSPRSRPSCPTRSTSSTTAR